MDTDVLRVFTGNYIIESDISKEDKLDLLKFVKVAEKDELLSLLANGDISEVNLENENLLKETENFISQVISEAYTVNPKPTNPRDIPNVKKSKEAMRKISNTWKDASGKKKAAYAAGAAGLGIAAIAAKKHMKKRNCKAKAGGNQKKYEACMAA